MTFSFNHNEMSTSVPNGTVPVFQSQPKKHICVHSG